MKAKIVLLDGVVVEVEGTAQDVADLTEALRRSHQIARPEDRRTTSSGTLPAEGTEPVETLALNSLGDGDIPEPLDDDEAGTLELDHERGIGEEDDEGQAEEMETPTQRRSSISVPPLDLVVRDVASQFRLLADPTRLQILTHLSGRGYNVGELCEALGGQSQPAVSHHLALLRVSGLVTPSREGKYNYYDLTDQGRSLTQALERFGTPDGSESSELFRQASDPTRLQILTLLSERDRNVGELCSDLGGQSQPAISHHLARLRHCGLVEVRREGKFSFYSLRDEGRELTRLTAPMMAARARGGEAGLAEAAGFETEAIDFSDIPDDWMSDVSSPTGDPVSGDPEAPGGAPPAHMLCRRVLVMVHELHRRGYERLRIVPGLSPSGLHWRCSIVPIGHVRRDHGALADDESDVAARYGSSQGTQFFNWEDAEHDSAVVLAGKFIERFPALTALGRGSDPEYTRWYANMLRATAPDGLIYAYADWELPVDHLPALGCTADVKIPLPPPGEADAENRMS